MKHLILATLFIVSTISTMEAQHWLQERIDKCKEGNGIGGPPDTDSYKNCHFMKAYIARYYLPMCGGQPLYEGLYPNCKEVACRLLHTALADEKFVNNIID